jgi:hypothetical protein
MMTTCVGCRQKPQSPEFAYFCTDCRKAIWESMNRDPVVENNRHHVLTAGNTTNAAWGRSNLGSVRPPCTRQRERGAVSTSMAFEGPLRRFADALGADDLTRIATQDQAMRRLDAALRLMK